MIAAQVDKLYSCRGFLLVCTEIKPFPTDKYYGWFGILFPTKNFNEFDHFLWSRIKPANSFSVKLTTTQKRTILKKSFKIREIEKKYQ